MANYVLAGIQWRDTTRHTEWIRIQLNLAFAKCISYFKQKHHLLSQQFVTNLKLVNLNSKKIKIIRSQASNRMRRNDIL